MEPYGLNNFCKCRSPMRGWRPPTKRVVVLHAVADVLLLCLCSVVPSSFGKDCSDCTVLSSAMIDDCLNDASLGDRSYIAGDRGRLVVAFTPRMLYDMVDGVGAVGCGRLWALAGTGYGVG